MADNIGTKLHKAMDIAPPAMLRLMEEMATVPTFVMDEELIDLFKDHHLQDSVVAMFEAGRAKLPYPKLMLELWGKKPYREFILIEETESPSAYVLSLVEYLERSTNLTDHGPQVIDSAMTAQLDFSYEVATKAPSWHVNYSDRKDLQRQDLVPQLCAALNLALVMAHVGEFERETIEPHKLNRVRAKAGKRSIPNHVIVRIGHVYDRAGNRIRITEANRRSIKVHMRAGHNRRQQHGKDWIMMNPEEAKLPMNTETMHIVWIAPVLVNYRDGVAEPLPLPKPRLVKL